jgi:leucine-zipper of insertion element IS481
MDNHHKNARLTVHSREQFARRVLEQGVTLKLAAAIFSVSEKTRPSGCADTGSWAEPAWAIGPRARTAAHAPHLLLYWKRFWLFADCGTTAGGSLRHSV